MNKNSKNKSPPLDPKAQELKDIKNIGNLGLNSIEYFKSLPKSRRTESVCLKALAAPKSKWSYNYDYFISLLDEDEITEKIALKAVEQSFYNLKYLPEKYKNKDVCMLAVRQNGRALEYIKDKDIDICMTAIKNNGSAINFIDYPNKEMFMTAVITYPIIASNGKAPEQFKADLAYQVVKVHGFDGLFYVDKDDQECVAKSWLALKKFHDKKCKLVKQLTSNAENVIFKIIETNRGDKIFDFFKKTGVINKIKSPELKEKIMIYLELKKSQEINRIITEVPDSKTKKIF